MSEREAKKTGIHRQSLRNWIKNKNLLMSQNRKHFRVKIPNLAERCECNVMESTAVNWLNYQRSKGVCVSEKDLKTKAIQTYEEIHPEVEPDNFERLCMKDRNDDFKFSNGWFENFLVRRSLVLRRITSTGRDLPADTLARINIFYSEVRILFFT